MYPNSAPSCLSQNSNLITFPISEKKYTRLFQCLAYLFNTTCKYLLKSHLHNHNSLTNKHLTKVNSDKKTMLLTEAHLELEPPKVVSAIQTETLSTNIISAKAVTSVHFHVYFGPLNQTSLVHQAPNRIALRLYIKLQLESPFACTSNSNSNRSIKLRLYTKHWKLLIHIVFGPKPTHRGICVILPTLSNTSRATYSDSTYP